MCRLSHFSCGRLCATPWTAALQASLSFTVSWSLPRFMSTESVMPFNHLILCCPLLPLPSIFPSIFPIFSVSQLFPSGGQSIGASVLASVHPMTIQGWFPLGLTGLISLQSEGLLRVFSNTTVQKHQFFSAQLSFWACSGVSKIASESEVRQKREDLKKTLNYKWLIRSVLMHTWDSNSLLASIFLWTLHF